MYQFLKSWLFYNLTLLQSVRRYRWWTERSQHADRRQQFSMRHPKQRHHRQRRERSFQGRSLEDGQSKAAVQVHLLHQGGSQPAHIWCELLREHEGRGRASFRDGGQQSRVGVRVEREWGHEVAAELHWCWCILFCFFILGLYSKIKQQ